MLIRGALRFEIRSRQAAIWRPGAIRSVSKLKNRIFVGAFLILIFTPVLAQVAGVGPLVQINENRTKAKPPGFNWAEPGKTIEQFENYFNDNFGLRNELILLNRAFRYYALGTSANKQVLIGNDGWLIFNLHGNLNETRNLELFTSEQVKKWGEVIQARSDYAKRNGAAYLLVIAPDPKTIYPEILPDWIPPPDARSRMTQLFEYLAANTDVQFLDLRPAIQSHRSEPIYFRTDTHWNRLGSYYAYRAIVDRLAQIRPQWAGAFKPIELNRFNIEPRQYSGDLSTLMGLPGLITEQTVDLVPQQIWEANTRPGRINEHNFSTSNPHRPDAPRLLIFRDSYATAFQALLAEHFSFVRFRWFYGFQRKLVKKDKPDIVIQFFVERVLAGELPRPFFGG